LHIIILIERFAKKSLPRGLEGDKIEASLGAPSPHFA
jgi:hypothetical protein